MNWKGSYWSAVVPNSIEFKFLDIAIYSSYILRF